MANTAPLDPSQPKDAHMLERLERDLIIWLTSVRPDGRPHSVPVWFLWEGSTLLLFSKPDQKVRNLQANAQVVVAVDNTGGGDDVILFEAEATLLSDGTAVHTAPTYVAKYQSNLDQMQWTGESMAAEYNQAIRITPTRWLFR